MQNGATITFSGKDIADGISANMLYDFGYFANSNLEDQMFSLAGATGGESFSYSFAYHGNLPGMATFNIMTDLSEGSIANVYRFDAKTNNFTQIADNIPVGANGAVSYRNNTMSDYLITTQKVEWAELPNAAQTENAAALKQLGSNLTPILILAALIIIAVIVFIILRGKKKQVHSPQ